MTLINFAKISAISAVACSLAGPATAQTQAQAYQQQQQAYYEGWQQYYRQYYGVNYHQPTFQNRRGYTTQQPQRTQSWNAPQQNQSSPGQIAPQQQATAPPAPAVQPDDYLDVQAHPNDSVASPVNLDAQESLKPQQAEVDNSVWYNSYEPAWRSAHKQGRPLVLLFVHEGCPECTRMDGYLAEPGAMETLACAVKARIEFTENAATVTRFGVKYTPTFLVLNPQGNEAYREVGALDVNRLRQIQPALESLVTSPPESETVKARASTDKKVSLASSADKISANNSATSQTLASL